ncbi:MAG: NIPSNAP domain-containing protein [Mycobacterium sp.]
MTSRTTGEQLMSRREPPVRRREGVREVRQEGLPTVMELHTYTLVSADALHRYTTSFWPRHIQSLRRHGITVHGVWIDAGTDVHRVLALVGYPPGSDPVRLAESYRASVEFVEDHANFELSLINSAQTTTLEPIPGSPLL